jgi:hypothetical protein
MFSHRQTVICANLLSNTAQALTSYVEALQDASNATDPLPFLEEALELFQKCLEYQEFQHQEFREQSAAAARLAEQETDTDDGGVSLTTGSTMDVDSEPGMHIPLSFDCLLSAGIFKPILFRCLPSLDAFKTDSRLYRNSFGESRATPGHAFLPTRTRRPLVSQYPESLQNNQSLTSLRATIVEPVTNSSLLDTILAQLRTLSLLCSLLPVPSGKNIPL